jgi:hypothetical protein
MLDGRSREMGLGPVHAIPLADARKRAAECRRMRSTGSTRSRPGERTDQKKLDAAKSMPFDACAAAYIDAHKVGGRNAKHVDPWTNTLATYGGPAFGSLLVQAVDIGLAMKALEPNWQTKSETASRLRGRIEAVLDWATVRGYRRATTRHISTSCSQRAARFRGCSITLPCRMTSLPILLRRCAARKASRRGRWSS